MCKQSFNKVCLNMLSDAGIWKNIQLEIYTHPRVARLHTQCGHQQESACIVKCMHKRFQHATTVVYFVIGVFYLFFLSAVSVYLCVRCKGRDVHKLRCHTWKTEDGGGGEGGGADSKCTVNALRTCVFFFCCCCCCCCCFYINPVFIWEECLEMSGSLKMLVPMRSMGTAGKCWHQQLEGRGGDGWGSSSKGGGGVNRLSLLNQTQNI